MIFNRIKDVFGGKIRVIFSTASVLCEDVHKYLSVATCSPIVNIYATAELGCICLTECDEN